MNAFQVFGIGLAALFALLVLLALSRRRLRALPAVAWTALWLAAGTAIARPELTAVVARVLGIDRGADLVFYLAILAMLVGFFVVSVRLRRIEEDLTRVIRAVALRQAESPDGDVADEGEG